MREKKRERERGERREVPLVFLIVFGKIPMSVTFLKEVIDTIFLENICN